MFFSGLNLLSRVRLIALGSSLILASAAPLSAQIDNTVTASDSSKTAELKEMLTAGKFSEALEEATALQSANPADYEAVYYLAMAQLGLNNFDAASAAAQQAQTMAPPEAQTAIAALVDTIKAQRGGAGDAGASSEAEVALADGLIGKAARLFDAAWAAGRGEPDSGLKAATLYADRLGQFADAGRLLNEVMRFYPESPAATKAAAELARLATSLATARSNLVVRAWGESWPAAGKTLLIASAIEPKNAALVWIRLAKASEAGDSTGARTAVADLAKLGPINIKSLIALPGIEPLTRQPEFSQFLLDVLGSESHERLLGSISPVPAVDTLQTLIARKAISYAVGFQCDDTRINCLYRSYYPITGISGESQCRPTFSLGRPSYNQFSDVLTSISWQYDEWRGLRLYQLNAGKAYLVERVHNNDSASSYSISFLVGSEADARSLIRQLHALRISCGNTEWPS